MELGIGWMAFDWLWCFIWMGVGWRGCFVGCGMCAVRCRDAELGAGARGAPGGAEEPRPRLRLPGRALRGRLPCARGAEAAVTWPCRRKRKWGPRAVAAAAAAMLSLDFLDDVRRMNKRQVPEGPGGLEGKVERADRDGPPCRALVARPDRPPSSLAVLPGVELRHDRVLRPHDLEGAYGGDGQRESHRGGAEVSPGMRGLKLPGCFTGLGNRRAPRGGSPQEWVRQRLSPQPQRARSPLRIQAQQ